MTTRLTTPAAAAVLQLAGLASFAGGLGLVALWAVLAAFGIGLIAVGVSIEISGRPVPWLRPPEAAGHDAATRAMAQRAAQARQRGG